jgi:hypothetical protein
MDINTMLSAAFDAYEKTKMELAQAEETIKELTDEINILKAKRDSKDVKEVPSESANAE